MTPSFFRAITVVKDFHLSQHTKCTSDMFIHSDVLVRQQLHKLECQQTVVNSLKLQVQTLKQTNTETERHLSYVNNERARETKDFGNKIRELEN